MSESKLPSASIENEFLRLEYLTTTGPRIIGLYTKNNPRNLLAETPDVHWETPHGEFYLRGGHRLWTAPENPFYTCPEEGLNIVEENDCVTLKSPIDASGFQKEITIQLDENCVHLSQRVTWCGEGSIELAPWSITQLRLGGIAILPLSQKAGFLPDRNIVLWPYSQVQDVRFELLDDMVLLYGRALEHAFKVGNYNSHGWIAYALGNVLFVKRFAMEQAGKYPDLGCNVETYVKDVCVELETLGTLATLNTNESVAFEETWEIFTGEYSTTLENARKISRQLSQSYNGA
jgi:hypothetical protein